MKGNAEGERLGAPFYHLVSTPEGQKKKQGNFGGRLARGKKRGREAMLSHGGGNHCSCPITSRGPFALSVEGHGDVSHVLRRGVGIQDTDL